ncbi:MAG: hypothetical protein OES47_02580 [Acidobacteriota bacterium]|nr:hypothetical protein [Acidobacteriota bacterium]
MEGPLLLRVFTHPACSGCTRAVREAWNLGEEHAEIEIRTVSLEDKEGLAEARAEKIRTIPTLVLGDRGSELRRWVGAPEPGALENGLRELGLLEGSPSAREVSA